MQKRDNKTGKKMLNKKRVAIALFEIFLMTFMTIAISVMMGGSVNGEINQKQLGSLPIGSVLFNTNRASEIGKSITKTGADSFVDNSGNPVDISSLNLDSYEAISYSSELSVVPGPTGQMGLKGLAGKDLPYVSMDDISNEELTKLNEIIGSKTDWGKLTSEQQSLAGKAGWDQTSWNSNIGSSNTAWDGAHPIKSIFGGKAFNGGVGGSLVAGAAWATTAFMAVKMLGGMLGLSSGMQDALSKSLAAGSFVAGYLNSVGVQQGTGIFSKTGMFGIVGKHPFAAGLVVAAVVFVLTYKEESKKTVTFTCLPYEPPVGGAKCEECNKDPFRPCSEYRCKALGQACQLLNAGTGNEKCAWVNPKDVNSPTIEPSQDALTSGMKYTPDNAIRPPNRGVKIIDPNDASGCIKAFTPLTFGVKLNEPAQCKLDYARSNVSGKSGYDSMSYYFGGTNFYQYNHTQQMRLPSPNSLGVNASVMLKNGDTMNLYVKCMDANGNVNDDDFVFTFCVNKGPDTTPPIIESTSIEDGGYVQYNIDNVPIEVYTNEPAQCRWSRIDKDYNDTENAMDCASNSAQINNQLTYTCSGNLTGVKNQEDNKFFFRCKDYPDNSGAGNNVMQQSYALTLKGSQPLGINYVKPEGEVRGNTEVTPVTLEVRSNQGAEEGKSTCYYSDSNETRSWLPMFETDNYISTQTLDLVGDAAGTEYIYYIRCIDAGGNSAESSTTFSVFVDKDAPIIARAYKESPDALKIIMSEEAECSYSLSSCNFTISDGIKMLYPTDSDKRILAAEWKNNAVYHIKCTDGYGNVPEASDCSLVVSAVDLNAKSA